MYDMILLELSQEIYSKSICKKNYSKSDMILIKKCQKKNNTLQ